MGIHSYTSSSEGLFYYKHVEDNYLKKEYSERWIIIGEDRFQRDLDSSFLIMNVNPNLARLIEYSVWRCIWAESVSLEFFR
ncbi:MAG: hypothetical protein WA113_04820 [Desulfitobacteriaceae bacterium]